MCDHCGCSAPAHEHDHDHAHDHGREVDVRQSVLSLNDRLAEQNRGFFRARGLNVLNLLSGPGAGKTTLIEKTQAALGGEVSLATIVGDLETENDADRIRESGGTAVQITTGEVCHLDAHMVQHALEKLPLDGVQILFIENVGNLVCPASFDLGEQRRVVLMSVTEGEDKPLKYPVIFHKADLVLITKADLAEAVEFDRTQALDHVRRVAPKATVLEVSAKTGTGMDAWLNWLRATLPSGSAASS